jgi:hypothetical protein
VLFSQKRNRKKKIFKPLYEKKNKFDFFSWVDSLTKLKIISKQIMNEIQDGDYLA